MKYFLWLMAMVAFASCKKNEEYPIEPIIAFKSISTFVGSDGKDSLGVIVISFTDGDGDIGLKNEDTLPPFNSGSPYYRNYNLELFERIDGAWVLNPISPDLGGRMPYLTPAGNNKALKGDIQLESNLPFQVTQDTCFFNIYIYDRALHKSNVVTTPEIIINTN